MLFEKASNGPIQPERGGKNRKKRGDSAGVGNGVVGVTKKESHMMVQKNQKKKEKDVPNRRRAR